MIRVGTGQVWLFVPGDRADRFGKAAQSGADHVIVDLEDAVAPESKPAARDAVASWLENGGKGWVRVNAPESPWWQDDLGRLSSAEGLQGVVVPKSESPADLSAAASLGRPVLALVESARGIHGAYDLASTPGTAALAFGSIDFALDVGCDETDDSLLLARSSLVLASRAAGLPAPVDGVCTALYDRDAVIAATSRARSLGFGSKLAVHPAQIPTIRAGLAPPAEAIAWARRVVGAQGAAANVDGMMVDRPLLERANGILERAAAHQAGS